ncbi:Lipf protein [Aphelenchoides avenae]|nr:Lipf protein [Aphelenchus avenae]
MPCWFPLTLLVLSGLIASTKANDASDPEVGMSAVDIIRYWNYPAEEHTVVTKDGYILRIQRIPHGKDESSVTNRPVVFLQHGLQGSSVNWLSNLPNQSAGNNVEPCL